MLKIRSGHTGAGQPSMTETTPAPFQTDRMMFSAVEAKCHGPPCRRPQTDAATPEQISRRRQWRAGYQKGPSTRQSPSSGQHDMQTEAAATDLTC